jgi:hypothetical protein
MSTMINGPRQNEFKSTLSQTASTLAQSTLVVKAALILNGNGNHRRKKL